MYKAIFLLSFCLKASFVFSQVGSLGDFWSSKNDDRLVSLNFNGRIYAPRHGSHPEEKYKARALVSDGSYKYEYTFRPVELFLSDDNGNSWALACPNPLFESIKSSTLQLQLSLGNETAIMRKIDASHFILATQYQVYGGGATKRYYFPIIYIFKESIRENYYNISILTEFKPEAIHQNKIIEISTVGNITTLILSNSDTVIFELNPDKEDLFEIGDSRGNSIARFKD